jgi:hypothetical protein
VGPKTPPLRADRACPEALAFARHGLRLLTLLAAVVSGCVTVYQPLVSLQRPVAVDPQLANLQGQRLLVRCVLGPYLAVDDAQRLCLKVRNLFAVQGAEVELEIPGEETPGGSVEAAFRPDLTLELRSRLMHEQNSSLLWILSAMTFTLVPTIAEVTFAQEVTIRDRTGFVLASDSLEGRFVRYFGLGVWGVNKTLDLLVREEDEELTGNVADQEFTQDFYRQLSQLAFDARMRSLVLRGFETEAPRTLPPAVPPPGAERGDRPSSPVAGGP